MEIAFYPRRIHVRQAPEFLEVCIKITTPSGVVIFMKHDIRIDTATFKTAPKPKWKPSTSGLFLEGDAAE